MKKKSGSQSLLFVGNYLSAVRGARQVGEDLAERLSERGWHVLLVSSKLNKAVRLLDMVWTTWAQRNRYRVAHVEIFSGLAFYWAVAVSWVLRLLGKPYVFTLHGGNLPEFARKNPQRVRKLFATAEIVTTPSRYLQESMRAYRSQLQLIPNPIDIQRYPFQKREMPKPRLVWLRSFHEIYNPGMAVRVLHQLSGEFPDIRMIMVGVDKGDGSYAGTLRLAEELGIQSRLEFPGRVEKDEVPTWLNKGDIFLNTTTIDNTPVSVLEAMACGLCVVSTNVGGIPYLLDDGVDSLLVPSGDVDSMSGAVRRILNRPELGKGLSENARKKAEGFDWNLVLPKWENLFLAVSRGVSSTSNPAPVEIDVAGQSSMIAGD